MSRRKSIYITTCDKLAECEEIEKEYVQRYGVKNIQIEITTGVFGAHYLCEVWKL